MRFHNPLTLLAFTSLTGYSVANHGSNNPKTNTTLDFRQQNLLTINQMPPACNLAACLGLSGTASCIVSALGSGDPAALQRCLVNGLAQICSCAACVPLVDNFLISLGVCVTKPGGNVTVEAEAVIRFFEGLKKGEWEVQADEKH